LSFPNQIEAVILAGGKVGLLDSDSPEPVAGKGLVLVGGVPMAARALQAVHASLRVSRTIVVSPVPPEQLAAPEWAVMSSSVEAGERLIDSFCSGVQSAQDPSSPVLICCGDLPFLTPEAVTDFVERCSRRPEASIWYCFLRKESSERSFPGVRHTWARLREGTFCGTGLMMLRPNVVTPVRTAMDSLTRARKNMLRLAGCLGWGTVLAYLCGQLTVAMAEKAGSRIFGVPCAGIESTFGEVGFNVDDDEDLREARRRASTEGATI
jgi:molybdopterin-guanine dinucleotide biosynthesis protein A